MDAARFEGRDEWMSAVQRALSCSDTDPILATAPIDRESVLTVARYEASAASEGGISTVSHARLAQLTGLPRSTVLKARLALIELGLMNLTAARAVNGQVHRVLHHP